LYLLRQLSQFLSITRRHLLSLARKGIAGAYALGTGTKRTVWVFRLSELAGSLASQNSVITKGPKYVTIRSGNLHAERGANELSAWIT
jgi:hypothetical protein